MDFVDNYSLLFGSIVIYCSVSLLYMIFYVNDKSQEINKENRVKLKSGTDSAMHEINKEFNLKRKQLIKKSKQTLFYFFLIEILANISIIIAKNYLDFIGFIGGVIFPLIAYYLLIILLIIAIGLKGQKVLIVRGLIHGRN